MLMLLLLIIARPQIGNRDCERSDGRRRSRRSFYVGRKKTIGKYTTGEWSVSINTIPPTHSIHLSILPMTIILQTRILECRKHTHAMWRLMRKAYHARERPGERTANWLHDGRGWELQMVKIGKREKVRKGDVFCDKSKCKCPFPTLVVWKLVWKWSFMSSSLDSEEYVITFLTRLMAII